MPAATPTRDHKKQMLTTDDKRHAHDLLDRLGPGQFAAVVHLLETLVSPDEDRNTLSPSEARFITEADEWSKYHEPIPHEQVLAEFGLSMNDWEEMKREPNGL